MAKSWVAVATRTLWWTSLVLTGCEAAPANAGGVPSDADVQTADSVADSDAAGGTDTLADSVGASDSSHSDVGPSDSGCSEGAACDDGDKCTTGDVCKAGACVGTPKVCDAGLPVCKQGSCEPSSGLCLISDKIGDCDDGDPCTQADNCLLGVCAGMPIQGCCTPSCVGKVCGDDGCGKSCGSCKAGEVCGGGACVKSSAAGETCADAVAIGTLPFQHVGTTLGAKNDLFAPDQACYNNVLGNYGPDVVYSYTATADVTLGITLSAYDNKPAFYVASDCSDIKNTCLIGQLGYGQDTLGPSYATVKQGQTAYIVVDADNQGGDYTLDVTTCVPNCAGKECGSDGCGGVCGYCQKLSAYECSTAGTCVCVPNCYDKTCGLDGCGGSCGSCTGGQICDDGSMAGQFTGNCVAPNQPGDVCSSAIAVDTSPFTHNGSTVGLGNNSYGWAFCDGNGTGAYYGDEAPDMMFAVGGKASATWLLELTNKTSNLVMYAMTDCKDPLTCKQAGYHPYNLKTQLLVETPTNAPMFIAVDGYSNTSGKFTLSATQCSKPSDCPEATPGDYCTFPKEINALPFKASGSIGLNSYRLPKGACGAPKELGAGGGNVAWRLQAPADGVYTFKAVGTGGMDPILYAATDCTQLAATCSGYADKTGEKGTETLSVTAKAGEVWFVILDAPTSVNGTFSFEASGP